MVPPEDVKIHGVEVKKRQGETLNKAIDRTKREVYAKQQTQTFFATKPAQSLSPKVVGRDYTPTLK